MISSWLNVLIRALLIQLTFRMKSKIGNSFCWAGLLAAFLAAGFLMVLGSFGANPSTADLYTASLGLSATNPADIPVAGRLAAAAWIRGGPQGLSFVRWGINWLAWTVGFLALFGGSVWLGRLLGGRWSRVLPWAMALLVAGVALASAVLAGLAWRESRRDFRLLAPVDLVQSLPEGERVYANPSAQPFVVLLGSKRNLVLAAPQAPPSDPTGWRAAIRQEPVGRVLLVGSVTEFRPLLDHLMVSEDWKLESISHHGWVFVRGAAHDTPLPDPQAIDFGNEVDTALALAQLGRRFDAMGATSAARTAMERSLELAPSEPEVLLGAAAFQAGRKRWHDVATLASRALSRGAEPSYAYSLLANALLESGSQAQAEDAIQRALSADPSNIHSLFLAAKIFRTSNDFAREAEILERLVKASEKAGFPAGGALAYLGQSYAHVGNAPLAIQAYRRALASGDLNDEQQAAVEEALALIESRASYNR